MGMRDALATVVKRRPRAHRAMRAARVAVGRLMPARRYDGIPGSIHFNDFMFGGGSPDEIASYAERARNVIAAIERVLEVAGKQTHEVERWLDFGCGYGRVIRFLVERVPPERVWACDVIEEGARFCEREFGVTALVSSPDVESVEVGRFDFLYAISVVSHLNERNTEAFLRLVGDALVVGGIALFTTHGEWSLEHAELYGPEYAEVADALAAEIGAVGIAYRRYPYTSDDYGMTWHSREFIETTMSRLHDGTVVPLMFEPHGLDGHQDVYAFRRVAPAR
jgi:SAM-dependent methyltransferase